MEKKAKITKCTFSKEWGEGSNKTFFHEIELDNGDKGSIGAKEKQPDKLKPGTEITYTIEPGQYGNKIKAIASQVGGFGGAGKKVDPKVQIVGFAMAYTKDLVVADKIKIDQLPAIFEKIHGLMLAKL